MENLGILQIWILGPMNWTCNIPPNVRLCSYKLAFDCSKNEVEYEALIARLKILKKQVAKNILVYVDFKLIIKQVKGE